jgi:hypothetical protein
VERARGYDEGFPGGHRDKSEQGQPWLRALRSPSSVPTKAYLPAFSTSGFNKKKKRRATPHSDN